VFTASLYVLLSWGCAEDEEPAVASSDYCTGRACACISNPITACDITATGCQRKVAERVACVRNAEVTLPEVEVITRDELRSRTMAMSEPNGAPDAGAAQSGVGEPTDMPAMNSMANADSAVETVLKQLELIEPGQTAEQSAADFTVSFIAGYYDGETERITLIDEQIEEQPQRSGMGLFAHELVHAAQDQEGLFQDIQQSHRQLWDGLSASRAEIEGEAELYGLLTEAAMLGKTGEQIGLGVYLDFRLKHAQEEIATASSPFWPAIVYPAYAVGAGVLYEAWREGGPNAVEETLATSTAASIGWMRGDPSRSIAVEALNMPEPPPDFSAAFSARMGANVIFAFLVTDDVDGPIPLAPSWDRARSWDGDTFTVYTNGERAAFAWRARFEDTEASLAFRSRVRSLPNVIAVSCDDTDSVLLWTDIDTETLGWRSIVTGGSEPCDFPLTVEIATSE
jgi:hypothetical protein